MAGRPLTIREVAALLKRAGFRGVQIPIMVAIAIGESGLRPDAVGDVNLQDRTWGPSVGLFQVRTLKNPAGEQWRDRDRLEGDPAYQARAAYAISSGGKSFKPWTVYTSGAWRSHYGRVREELAGVSLDGIRLPGRTSGGGPVDAQPAGGIPGPIDDWLLDKADDWATKLKGIFIGSLFVAAGLALIAGGVLKSGAAETVVNLIPGMPGRSAAA